MNFLKFFLIFFAACILANVDGLPLRDRKGKFENVFE